MVLGEKLYQSPYCDTSSVFDAHLNSENVIIKRRSTSMQREKEVLESLNSNYFPRLKGSVEHDAIHYLALEKRPGIPLGKYIDLDENWLSRKLTIDESVGIIQHLALGLIALRDCGYYYRDFNLNHILITDENVSLVDHEADVKIGIDRTALVDVETGTWETMAPEEFDIGSKMLESATTYSLAVILYQLTHGSNLYRLKPMEDRTNDEKRELSRILHLKPPLPENFEHLRPFFTHALNPNPKDRVQNIEEFIANLEKL